MNNEQISKLVTEALGGCWHEWNRYLGPGYAPAHYLCIKCGTSCYRPAQDAPNIDYATDERACVKLWEQANMIAVKRSVAHGWVVTRFVGLPIDGSGVKAVPECTTGPTFCLAVCKAFLKSKDIELENEQ